MLSARGRQKKRERKRQNKRRGPPTQAAPTMVRASPVSKMSNSLDEYAEILQRRLSPDADVNEWTMLFNFAAATWNMAVTGDDDERAEEIAPDLCRLLGFPPEEAPDLIEEMINRKHELFHADDRMVVGVKVLRGERSIEIVAVSASLP